MNNTYYLTSKRLTGYIEVQFINGLLKAVTIAVKDPLNEKQFRLLAENISMHEADLGKLKMIGLAAEKQAAPNEKIALFCEMYEKHKGIKYIVGKAESGKIKLVKFDRAGLEIYFNSQSFYFKGKQSISNLVKYYNEYRAEVATIDKPKYPDYFDKAFQAKLPVAEHKIYWSHLRSLGLEPVKDRFQVVIDWKKK